ncbi:hypothetical protein [uncultured Maricaulis sp.]|uniref:hypothetical protein n=1 Tax=uncultured Maricaulis sp. TaxID=174710 RepID=UPI0030D76ACF|tara:strand:+ start:68578 stop:68838 length:261 start_codon:yes stop_codon:yes gene_type:complete
MSEPTPDAPAPKTKSAMDRITIGVIALVSALFGLPMVYSSGTQIGAMFAGTMPSLWTVALLPIGLGLAFLAIRLGIAALTPGKPKP